MLAPLRMPGASLMSRLKVYDTAAIDGQIGGTPHVHLLCTEMYLVLGGSGAVEIIDKNGFSRVDLGQHDALLFSEGTIHRLINPNGDLEILVIMQNSGLPERGDNVVCFSEETLASDTAYAQAMRVSTLEDAYQRRNRGVEGFLELKAAFARSQAEGQAALERFYGFAAERTKSRHEEWHKIVQSGAMSAAQDSQNHLDALAKQNIDYLSQSNFHLIKAKEAQSLGFCGHLDRYFDPASLMPEGIRKS
jgi:mannose-6-phosphate isomerase-like protein (cupin superfamily)